MNTENLKVVITGDTSDLDKASAKATKSLDNISKSAAEWDKRARELNLQTNYTSRSFASLANSAAKFQPEVTKSAKGFNGLGQAGKQANFAMISLSQGIGDLPYGFSAIANNAQQTIQAFTYLKQSSGSTGAAFKALGASLIGPTGLFIGFSAVSAIMTALIRKYGSLSNAAQQLFGHLNDQEKAQERLNKALEDGAKELSGSITNLFKVQSYVKLAADGYISADNAVNKFNNTLGKTFGKVTSLKQAQDKLTESSSNYIQAVTYNIVASKLMAQASDEIVKNIQLQAKTNEEAASGQAKIFNFLKVLLTGTNESGKNIFENWSKDLKDLNSESGKAAKRLSQLTTQNNVDKILKQVQENAEKAAKAFAGVFNEKQAKTAGKTISSVLKDLNKDLKGIDLKQKTGELGYLDVAAEKVKAYTKALRDLGELGAKPTSKDIQEITKQINILKGQMVEALPTNLRDKQFLNVVQGQNANDVFQPSKVPQGGINPNINGDRILGITNNDKLKEAEKEQLQWINQMYNAGDAVANVFENMFSAIANNGDPFKALIQSIEQLIVRLAAAAAAAAVLFVLTGGLSAGGSSLGSFKEIFSTLSGWPKFAKGGFVQGPQLAVVGDAPGGEWILNQRQMSAILNGNVGNREVKVTGEFSLRGNDLRAAIKRAEDANSRVN